MNKHLSHIEYMLSSAGIKKGDVIAILVGDLKNSSDVDVYCIIEDRAKISFFSLDVHDGRTYEIFVDTYSDTVNKIEKTDILVVDFLNTFNPTIINNFVKFKKLKKFSEVMFNRYYLNEAVVTKLNYRIGVLKSKLDFSYRKKNLHGIAFFANTMVYPLAQIIFEKLHIFPGSPKRWLELLEKNMNKNDYNNFLAFIDGSYEKNRIEAVLAKYYSPVRTMFIEKTGNNDSTFIS